MVVILNLNNYWPRDIADFEYVGEESLHVLKVQNSDDIQIEFYSYSKNFFEAANILISHALETTEIRKKDFWFFPIVYLYRQSLELLLKSIAFKYIIDIDDRKNFISRVRHNLKHAFEEIKVFVKDEGLDLSVREIEWLEKYLTDISSIDEQSDMFRYPFNINMKDYFTEQIHINLKALGVNMNNAYEILTDILNKEVKNIEFLVYPPILLINGGGYYEQSVIGWKFNKVNFYPYIEGYMESADYLCKIIKEKQNSDNLFLPMCYLYRNGIELALKRILIEDCQFDYDTALNILRKKKHSILGLWNSIKQEIQLNSNSQDDDNTLINVELYINQLHNIDITSDKFRYPVDKFFNLHFNVETKYDVVNVSTFFNELFSFLDAVDSMLSYINDIKAELEADMWDY
jgi:hypothetical protein